LLAGFIVGGRSSQRPQRVTLQAPVFRCTFVFLRSNPSYMSEFERLNRI